MNFLVADDSVEVLECLRKFLEKEGHSVRCTGDGEEALQIFRGEEHVCLHNLLLCKQEGANE